MLYTRQLICLAIFLTFVIGSFGQVDTMPRMLLALDDSLTIYQGNQAIKFLLISKPEDEKKEIWFDLDQNEGQWRFSYELCTKVDTLAIQERKTTSFVVPVTNGIDTFFVGWNFYNSRPNFSEAYQQQHKGKTFFHITPIYELVNIVLFLAGMESINDLETEAEYYPQKVLDHFGGQLDHPLIRDFKESLSNKEKRGEWRAYLNHSISMVLQDGSPAESSNFPLSFRVNPWIGERFAYLKDFSKTTDYPSFFKAHSGYYQKLIHEQQQLLPLDSIWQWMEEQFTPTVDGCKVMFSPLAGKDAFYRLFKTPDYSEYILFINSADDVLSQELPFSQKKMIRLNTAFNQLLPVYQDPVLAIQLVAINEIFGDESKWVTPKNSGDPLEICSVYMTQSLFCLFLERHYPAEQVRKMRLRIEEEMQARGFIRFYAFSRELISFFEARADQKIADSYSAFFEQLKNR